MTRASTLAYTAPSVPVRRLPSGLQSSIERNRTLGGRVSGYRVSHETEVTVLMDKYGPLLVQAGGLYYKRIDVNVFKHVSKFTANRMIRKAIRERYRDRRD